MVSGGSFANFGGSGLKPVVIGNVKGVTIFPKHSSSDIIQSYVPSRLAPDWGIEYSHVQKYYDYPRFDLFSREAQMREVITSRVAVA